MKPVILFLLAYLALACKPDPKNTAEAMGMHQMLSGIAVDSQELAAFIPEGYTILEVVEGDLNGDGNAKDIALALRERNEEAGSDAARPLLLLVRKNKSLEVASSNDEVILCAGCGGTFGDPFEGISIKIGQLTVNHSGGSRDRWTSQITFDYHPDEDAWILTQVHQEAFDALGKESNLEVFDRSPKDFGNITFSEFSNKQNLN